MFRKTKNPFTAMAAFAIASAMFSTGCNLLSGALGGPTIHSIDPSSGPRSTTIRLIGENFGTPGNTDLSALSPDNPSPDPEGLEIHVLQAALDVTLTVGVSAEIEEWTENQITFHLPPTEELVAGSLGILVRRGDAESNIVEFTMTESGPASIKGWVLHDGEPRALFFSTVVVNPPNNARNPGKWDIDVDRLSGAVEEVSTSTQKPRQLFDFGSPYEDVHLLSVRSATGRDTDGNEWRNSVISYTREPLDDSADAMSELQYFGPDYVTPLTVATTGSNPAAIVGLGAWEDIAVLGTGSHDLTIHDFVDGHTVKRVPLDDLNALLPQGQLFAPTNVLSIKGIDSLWITGGNLVGTNGIIAHIGYSLADRDFNLDASATTVVRTEEALSFTGPSDIDVSGRRIFVAASDASGVGQVVAYGSGASEGTIAAAGSLTFDGYTVRDLRVVEIDSDPNLLGVRMLWVALASNDPSVNDAVAGIDLRLFPTDGSTATYASLEADSGLKDEAKVSEPVTAETHFVFLRVPPDRAQTSTCNVTTDPDCGVEIQVALFAPGATQPVTDATVTVAVSIQTATGMQDLGANDYPTDSTGALAIRASHVSPGLMTVQFSYFDGVTTVTATAEFWFVRDASASAPVVSLLSQTDEGAPLVNGPTGLYDVPGTPFVFVASHGDSRVVVLNGWGVDIGYHGEFPSGAAGPSAIYCAKAAQ